MMTVKQLKNALKGYPDATHVAVAFVPMGAGTFVHSEGLKIEINGVEMDKHGVLNVVAKDNPADVSPFVKADTKTASR